MSWHVTAERFFGIPANKMIGQSLAPLFRLKDRDRLLRAVTRLQPGAPVQLRRVACIRDNATHVRVTATLCALKNTPRAAGTVLVLLNPDPSAARQRARLIESREQYHRLFHNVPVGLYRSTVDGRIVDANSAFLHMLGYPDLPTLRATNALNLYVDAAVRRRWIESLRRDGIVVDFESQLQRYDGSPIWVQATGRVAVDAVRRQRHFEGVVVDVTDRKRAESEQALRTAELHAFFTISRRLRAARTPAEMYPGIVEQSRTLLAADHGSLALLNPDGGTFTRAYTVGIPGEHHGSVFPSAATLSARVVRDGSPFVTANFARDVETAWADAAEYQTLGAVAIVPVQSEEGIVGTLCVARMKVVGGAAFTDTEVRLLEGIAEVAGNAIRRASLHQNLQDAYVQIVVALAHAVETRDMRTAGHCERLVDLADRLARELECSVHQIEDVRWAARLHDIGKIGVSDAVLTKPASLSEQEWAVIRQHPALGEEILNSVERMRGVAKLVRHHHERWDGTGYPDGLRDEAIPLGARILAIVDAYGAITETRLYRGARSHAEALEEIRRCSGTQFDPRIVEVFASMIETRQ